MEAIVLSAALEPLANGNDALGGYGTDALAQSIAQHDRSGFGALIAASLERD